MKHTVTGANRQMFTVFLVVCMAVLLAGCSTIKPASAATPAQIAAAVCPVVQNDIATYQVIFATSLPASNLAKVSADLSKAAPVIAALCSGTSTVSTASVQAFITTGLPALADTINYLPLSASQKAKVTQDLLIAELAVGVVGVVESQLQAPAAASSAPIVPLPTLAK